MTENNKQAADGCQRCVFYTPPARLRNVVFWVIVAFLVGLACWQGYVAHKVYMRSEVSAKHAQLWKDIVAHSPQTVIVVDSEGKVADWNAGATQLLSYDVNDVIGKPLVRSSFLSAQITTATGTVNIASAQALEDLIAAEAQSALNGQVFSGVVQLRTKHGIDRTCSVRVQGVRNGHPWYVVQLFELETKGKQFK